MPTGEVALSLRVITAKASRRIAEVAFEMAAARREHVTVIGKRHVPQTTAGLFMQDVAPIAARHPAITPTEVDAESLHAELCTPPHTFAVFLATKRYAHTLSTPTTQP